MNLHQIVEALYRDSRVNEFIRKCRPTDLQDDLLHHCITEVYRIAEKYPGKIERLHDAGELWPWFHGMICQQLMSEKSTFYTRYRRSFSPLEHLPPDLHAPERYQDRQRELYDTIYIRNGRAFAEYAFNEVDRMEDERVINYGRKVRKDNQMQLFYEASQD